MNETPDELHLDLLLEGTPGITPEVGGALAQAASICLERENHTSCISLLVDGDWENSFTLCWGETTEQMKRCWADIPYATEHGAYGIAALLISKLTALEVVERSVKGTGFDYWLGGQDDNDPLFQRKARLEVSGIQKGGEREIQSRLRQKLEQTKQSDGKLPAYVAIIEFSLPKSRMVKK